VLPLLDAFSIRFSLSPDGRGNHGIFDEDRLWRGHGNHNGRDLPGTVLNLSILACAACAYLANQWLFKGLDIAFFHAHFNDIVAGTILLAWSNLVASVSPRTAKWVGSARGSILILAGAGAAWEGLAPMVMATARADPVDLACYFLGGAIYGLIAWVWRPIPLGEAELVRAYATARIDPRQPKRAPERE
jgi:hypothetical protein